MFTIVYFLLNLLIFLLGISIGSFLNCVIYRLEKNESFLWGRSYCPHCKHILAWYDLIPVVSFLWLGGKCRYCSKKISWQYPLVEILTGLMFLLIFNYQFPIFNVTGLIYLVFWLYAWSSLIVILLYDLRHYLIPDSVLFPAISITFIFRFFEFYNFGNWDLIGNWKLGFGNFIAAAIVASLFFLSIFLISKGKWMGFGDVKLAVLLGLLLGFPNILLCLFLTFLLGAIIGSALMLLHKKGLKSEVPFAPFLIVGAFLAMFFGNQIIQWYSHFLLF